MQKSERTSRDHSSFQKIENSINSMAGLSSTPKSNSREMQAPEGSGAHPSALKAGKLERTGGVAKAVASKWNVKSDTDNFKVDGKKNRRSSGSWY